MKKDLSLLTDKAFFDRFREAAARIEPVSESIFSGCRAEVRLVDSGLVFTVSGAKKSISVEKGGDSESCAGIEFRDSVFDGMMTGAVNAMIMFNRREWRPAADDETAAWFMAMVPYLGRAYRDAARG